MNLKLEDAIKVLCEELEKDKAEGSYYYTWQANIAMAFQDEFNSSKLGQYWNANEPQWVKDINPTDESFIYALSNKALAITPSAIHC